MVVVDDDDGMMMTLDDEHRLVGSLPAATIPYSHDHGYLHALKVEAEMCLGAEAVST